MPASAARRTFAALKLTTLLSLAILCIVPAQRCCAGASLRSGDLVMVDSYVNTNATPQPSPGLWRLDPTTLDTTRIASGGLLVWPDRVAVSPSGIIYVADHVSGLVSIDARTGVQSLVAGPAALGGTARGICLALDGTLYVTT